MRARDVAGPSLGIVALYAAETWIPHRPDGGDLGVPEHQLQLKKKQTVEEIKHGGVLKSDW